MALVCAPFLGGCFFFDDGCPDEPPAPVQIAEKDLDRDGTAGSEDCDDADPTLHPTARDIPDDGIDQDCSGVDATEHQIGVACQRALPAYFIDRPGNTAQALVAEPATCGDPAVGSVAYLLVSEVPARVTLQVESATPHTLHLRASCTVADERACEAAGSPVVLDFLPNVPLYVLVSATAEPGPFVLHAARVSLAP